MKIGVASNAYFRLDDPKSGLARIKKYGFDAIDYGMLIETENELWQLDDAGFERALNELRAVAEETGVEISQTHGPWRWPPRDATPEDRSERFEKMSRALRATAILGCKYCVIHPIMPFNVREEQPDVDALMQLNIEYFTALCKVAEEVGVIICLETMPFPLFPLSRASEILSFVKLIDSPYLRCCLDTGHCAVCGESPADAVRLWGTEYLRVMHVHDNNGQRDMHWLPYNGIIDWNDFAAALKEIGFEGVVSLECSLSAKLPADVREYLEYGFAMIGKSLI